jgi:hypothetical protein
MEEHCVETTFQPFIVKGVSVCHTRGTAEIEKETLFSHWDYSFSTQQCFAGI